MTRRAARTVLLTSDDSLVLKLSGGAFLAEADGSGSLLIPTIIVDRGGLQYDPGDQTFRGSIRVGLQDSLQRRSSRRLPDPVEFLLTGEADEIIPDEPVVSHTNLPFHQVDIAVGTPGDSVRLTVRSALNVDGVPVSLPVVRREPRVSVTPAAIQGFGLESATVLIGPVPDGQGVVAGLAADRGNLDSVEVVLGPEGTATTAIRSSGLGRSVVTIRSLPFQDTDVRIDFVFPTVFLVVTLLGGTVGGLGRWLQQKIRDKGEPIGSIVAYALGGALVGLLVAVLHVVGVNLTGFHFTVTTGQAISFALAGLGGYFGGSILTLGHATPG
ncbi:MAG: hypothetical protein MJB57_11820 [Gemmatimonadetes bacterium]|nr:hypothetical protein [Gemmatimonadota bacterium]